MKEFSLEFNNVGDLSLSKIKVVVRENKIFIDEFIDGDVVLIQSDKETSPYIAKICGFAENHTDDRFEIGVQVRWFYRVTDIKTKRSKTPCPENMSSNEVLYSNHEDCFVSVESILSRCHILHGCVSWNLPKVLNFEDRKDIQICRYFFNTLSGST
jgi:hypothetical protein